MPDVLTPSALAFDATAHRYTLGDRVLPSVTQVLRGVGAIETDWFTDEARRRGTWVHEACAMLDRGELDETAAAEQAPDYWPYVVAYQRFLTEAKPDICDIERRVADPIYGYAGTLDRTLFLNDEWALLDLKTGGPARWHALQTAAYARLRLNDNRMPRRYALYLRPDGTFRLDPFLERRDESLFLAAVSLVHYLTGDRA